MINWGPMLQQTPESTVCLPQKKIPAASLSLSEPSCSSQPVGPALAVVRNTQDVGRHPIPGPPPGSVFFF